MSCFSYNLYPVIWGVYVQNNVALSEYRLSASIYSTSKRQFVGRFLDTMPCDLLDSLERGAVVCPINQVCV